MSVKVMGAVFDLSIAPNLKLVLLAYADHASHDGENVRPAVALVAAKTNYSERQVQRVTTELAALGYLIPRNDRVGGRAKANRWGIPYDDESKIIIPVKPRQSVGVSELGKGDVSDLKGVKSSAERVTSEPERVTPVSPESSLEPSLDPSENQARFPKNDLTPLAQVMGILSNAAGGSLYKKPGPMFERIYGPLRMVSIEANLDPGKDPRPVVKLTHPAPELLLADDRVMMPLVRAFGAVLDDPLVVVRIETEE